jgi:DNA-binding response OmpR family regulator
MALKAPHIQTEIPGPRSRELVAREQRNLAPGLQGFALSSGIAVDHAQGSVIEDVDGNRYVDLIGGIGVNSLGHCDWMFTNGANLDVATDPVKRYQYDPENPRSYEILFPVMQEALDLFDKIHPDVVLLDIMMPKIDGFEVCREIRKKHDTPVIMITARGEDFERIMGLDIGADDYIVKPFSPGEVMARIRAVLRRISREDIQSKQIFSFSNLTINLDEYIVTIDGRKVLLTKKETEILWTLAANRNKVFSRDNLLNSLWGYEYFGDTRTVDSHIKRLRAKLDEHRHEEWEIKTIWGVGYKFEVNSNEK